MSSTGAIWTVFRLAAIVAAVMATFWLPGLFPPKVHSWILGAGVVITAISEAHFKGLISELQNLLRRGSLSTSQLDAVNQLVPARISRIWRLWLASICLKVLVGVAAAALQLEHLAYRWMLTCILGGYYLLLISMVLALYASGSLRKTEHMVTQIAQRENEIKERNRLLKELKAGDKHDFPNDKFLQGYNKPAENI